MRGVDAHDVFRCTRGDDQPTTLPTLRPEIDDPVRRLDHVQIMLDTNTVLPRSTNRCSTSSSTRTSSKCSPVVGSSKDVDCASCIALRHRGGELDALCLAAR